MLSADVDYYTRDQVSRYHASPHKVRIDHVAGSAQTGPAFPLIIRTNGWPVFLRRSALLA